MTSTSEHADAEPTNWSYEPAADLDQSVMEQLRGFPREPHISLYALRSAAALLLRTWFKLYHRFEIVDASRLPIGSSFILVSNHQSHLDALMLTASIPLRYLHRAFPAAAADYFFSTAFRAAVSSIFINGLPFNRKGGGAASLVVCRQLLRNAGNILIIFPEGTRSTTGLPGAFLPGIGHLAVGEETTVVPCYLEGAFRAFPKGARFPRPRKVTLRIGEPRSYASLPASKDSVRHVCADLREAVFSLQQTPSLLPTNHEPADSDG
ncbi:MAG: 1-acyl-sn-glycerol-3-phosphate acyltransferase [Rhodothermales bacterium]|jgi:1-acyl-sn-glycerol-3-phosphate acyltransferase